MEEKIIQKLSKKYNKKEQMISLMYKQSKAIGYSIKDFDNLLSEFYKKK